MTLPIDDAFIREWHPRYDDLDVGADYKEYATLVTTVAQEMNSMGTISENTFLVFCPAKIPGNQPSDIADFIDNIRLNTLSYLGDGTGLYGTGY